MRTMIERTPLGMSLRTSKPAQSTVYCIVPAYRAGATIVKVVEATLPFADCIIVVDDACPEHSGAVARAAFVTNAAVQVIERERNGGVGAAMKTGIASALAQGADIIVKIDADGQMDSTYIDTIRAIFIEDASLVCIKGNRFFDPSVITRMPKIRFLGNAALSLFAKCASGYWNTIDPTNGYIAFNANLLRLLPWQSFADSYFFEISVLCELGLRRLPILELEMPTIYNGAPSSLSIGRVLLEFPRRLFALTMRRLLVQYFVFDINLGTVYGVLGLLLTLFGVAFGGFEWTESLRTGVARQTGTVMIAVLTFLMGFQLLLNALMYDVQFSGKTQHELRVKAGDRAAKDLELLQSREYLNSKRD